MGVHMKNREIEQTQAAAPADYHAYLLRLWREGAQKPWRAELVSPHTGDHHHFARREQLLAFLAELTAADTVPDHTERI